MTHLPQPPQRMPLDALRTAAGKGAAGRTVVQRMAWVWLLLALVVVPTLGRLHQVAHGGALDRVHAGQQALALPLTAGSLASADAAVTSAEQGHGIFLPLLLAGHAPADCLLLDQLALGDTLHSAPLALPDAVPAQALPMHSTGRTGEWHVALFRARGPPAA